MNYLLDTCLLSELIKSKPNQSVMKWVEDADENRFFVSVLSLGEIQKGIAKLRDGEHKRKIQTWFEGDLQKRFVNRIIALDLEISLEWGLLCGASEKKGSPVPAVDSLLAATAICRNLTVVTRNESDFVRFAVRLLNPWNDPRGDNT